MHDNDSWVIIDTETSGLRNPVCPVEIAAQTMQGWQPVGEPWRVLLNFDVPIEPIAEKMHGYSREYLRKNGSKPSDAFRTFSEYAKSLPLVSYNLSFDWRRVLEPTIDRMHVRSCLRPGFCALNLTRHVVPSLQDFKLKTLISTFRLAEKQVHHAEDDVAAVALLLSKHIGPHLDSNKVVGYEKVSQCAQGLIAVPALEVGPEDKRKRKPAFDKDDLFAIGELVGICRAITLDKIITDEEINFLAQWLESCPRSAESPFKEIYNTVHEVVADGKVTEDERALLMNSIEMVLSYKQQIRVQGIA